MRLTMATTSTLLAAFLLGVDTDVVVLALSGNLSSVVLLKVSVYQQGMMNLCFQFITEIEF